MKHCILGFLFAGVLAGVTSAHTPEKCMDLVQKAAEATAELNAEIARHENLRSNGGRPSRSEAREAVAIVRNVYQAFSRYMIAHERSFVCINGLD